MSREIQLKPLKVLLERRVQEISKVLNDTLGVESSDARSDSFIYIRDAMSQLERATEEFWAAETLDGCQPSEDSKAFRARRKESMVKYLTDAHGSLEAVRSIISL